MPVDDIMRQPHIKTMPVDQRDRVCEALANEFSHYKTRCISMQPRDSNFIDIAYRTEIAKLIESASENRILITHGTDTLLQTADFFFNRRMQGKSIIVTGAMVPLSNGKLSDGYRNLAFSLDCLSQSEPLVQVGVVLCDFEDPETMMGAWRPRFYAHEPEKYEIFHHPSDHRYNHPRIKDEV